jgi:ATP-dependent protease Clp ATPase subunit
MTDNTPLPPHTFCSFCAASAEERKFILVGQGASICNNCIEIATITVFRGATLETFEEGIAQLKVFKK